MATYFQTYTSNRFQKLNHHLQAFEKKADESHLHEIRIELKKVLTIMSFYIYLHDNKLVKKTFLSYQSIFHKAGKIREDQLLDMWLYKCKLKSLQKIIFSKMEIEIKVIKFQKDSKAFNKSIKKGKNVFEKYGKDTNEAEIQKYINVIKNNIRISLFSIPPSDQWHLLRKECKKLIFAIGWFDNNSKVQNPDNIFTKLQREIGTWHDKKVMLRSILHKKEQHTNKCKIPISFSMARIKLIRSIRYSENKIATQLAQAAKITRQNKFLK